VLVAVVIPALVAYFDIVAVKTLVVVGQRGNKASGSNARSNPGRAARCGLGVLPARTKAVSLNARRFGSSLGCGSRDHFFCKKWLAGHSLVYFE